MIKYFILLVITIILIIIFLIIILVPSTEQLEYAVWNTLNIFFLSDETKEKTYRLLIEFITKIRNIKIISQKKIINEETKMINVNIPDSIKNWQNKIGFCDKNEGNIDIINYDEIIRPTKSSVTLY